MNQKETTRIFWLDFIRAIAILGVVVIHAAAPLLYNIGSEPLQWWWIGNIYDSLSRVSVPLFIMISGALLLPKPETLFAFFKKRFFKLIIPLLAWSFIYKFNELGWSMFQSLPGILVDIISGNVRFHLWYLYTLIGLYLFIPILRPFIQNSKGQLWWYFIFLWAITVSALPVFEKLTRIKIGVDLPMSGGYTGYLILGYLLAAVPVKKRDAWLSTIIFLIGVALTAAGTYKLSAPRQEFNGYFYDYLSINIILLSACAFISLRAFGESSFAVNNQYFKISIQQISRTSFGIYLIHMLALGWVTRGQDYTLNPAYMISVNVALTMIISYLLTLLLQRVPILKQIVPH